jgi:hypothetical protein
MHSSSLCPLLQAGVTPERYEEMVKPLMTNTKSLLSGMDAVRSAYQKTLSR